MEIGLLPPGQQFLVPRLLLIELAEHPDRVILVLQQWVDVQQGILLAGAAVAHQPLVERVKHQANGVEEIGHSWPPGLVPDALEGRHQVRDGLVPREPHRRIERVEGHGVRCVGKIEEEHVAPPRLRDEPQQVKGQVAVGVDTEKAWLGRAIAYGLQRTPGQQLDEHRFAAARAADEELMFEQRGEGEPHLDLVPAVFRVSDEHRVEWLGYLRDLAGDLR